ncbi:MAG: EAL domain-containing protein [Leptospirales bacterium]|nr:EAL domain-containing protein [Leptospirales bacterium]
MSSSESTNGIEDLQYPSAWSERVRPFFQPIVDLDTLSIFGFEQLGRLRDGAGFSSMGPIFQSIHGGGAEAMARALAADLELQKQGLQSFRQQGAGLLFINVNPRLLEYQFAEQEFHPDTFPLSQMARAMDVPASRIVLEITEEDFAAERLTLTAMVNGLKEYGFLIAVDDLGAKMSGLSRLALLEPDIIKVDLEFMRNSRSHSGYRKLLTAIAFVADRLGSTLLFEGIEEEEELMGALQMGGRLVQGYFLGRPGAEFGKDGGYGEMLRPIMENYTRYRIAELVHAELQLDQNLQDLVDFIDSLQRSSAEDLNEQLRQAIGHAPASARELTIFDASGNQASSCFVREDEQWRIAHAPPRNISWRTFFQRTLAQYRSRGRRYNISEAYQEKRSGDLRASVAVVLGDERVLLVELDWNE